MSEKELYTAISSGNTDKVIRLLAASPSLLYENIINKTWLNWAAIYNKVDIIEFLVEIGIPVDVDWYNCESPLSSAANHNSVEAAQWLLEHGANPNGTSTSCPPIVGAIDLNSIQIVQMLLDFGASVNFRWGFFGYSPLEFAKSFGKTHCEIISILEPLNDIFKIDKSNAVKAYLQKFYGEVDLLSDKDDDPYYEIDIFLSRDTMDHKELAICTSGMSSILLNTPTDLCSYRRSELLMHLPIDWPIDEIYSKEKNIYWPIDWLRTLAHLPHKNNKCIEPYGVIFTNEEPPKPIAENIKFSCFLVLPNYYGDGQSVDCDGDIIRFYLVYPIYTEEWEWVKKFGTSSLIEKFKEFNISTVIDTSRKNVGILT